MYISIGVWRDLTDGHLYHEGEPFPFDGRAVDAQRLAQLQDGSNRAGLRLIRAAEAEAGKNPAQQPKAPEGAKMGQKTPSAPTRGVSKPKKGAKK